MARHAIIIYIAEPILFLEKHLILLHYKLNMWIQHLKWLTIWPREIIYCRS